MIPPLDPDALEQQARELMKPDPDLVVPEHRVHVCYTRPSYCDRCLEIWPCHYVRTADLLRAAASDLRALREARAPVPGTWIIEHATTRGQRPGCTRATIVMPTDDFREIVLVAALDAEAGDDLLKAPNREHLNTASTTPRTLPDDPADTPLRSTPPLGRPTQAPR